MRNLLITRTGEDGLYPRWLRGTGRNFDLVVSHYAPSVPRIDAPGVRYIHVPGRKLGGYRKTLREIPDLLSQYDTIALFDDDIDADAPTISRCFDIGAAHGLELWQPSLTPNSYFTYASFVRNPFFRLRYTNYIESQVPFFSNAMLQRALPLFDFAEREDIDTGIDLIWGRLLDEPEYKFGIIDETPVHHTRPIGSTRKERGLVDANHHLMRIHKVLDVFDAPWTSAVSYAGIRTDGRRIDNRAIMAALQFPQARAIYRSPMSPRWTAKTVLRHMVHSFAKRRNMERLDLSVVEQPG